MMDEKGAIMKACIGYFTSLVVLIPFLAAVVYELEFSRGDMDGFGIDMFAMCSFFIGGLWNLIFLGFSLTMKAKYLSGLEGKKRKVAQGAIFMSALTFFAQLFLVLYFIWIKSNN